MCQREFVKRSLDIASLKELLPSQAMSAMNILAATLDAYDVDSTRTMPLTAINYVLLHRAFRFLLRSNTWQKDASLYFATVPLPTSVVVVTAGIEENLSRLAARGNIDVTRGLSANRLQVVVESSQEIAKLALRL